MVRVSRTVAVVAVVAAVGLTVAGCAADTGPGAPTDPPAPAVTSSGVTSPPSATSPTPAAGAAVPQTLAFTATAVDGQPFDAATLAGRPVVLWFWAAWCPRCRAAADDVAGVPATSPGGCRWSGSPGWAAAARRWPRSSPTRASAGSSIWPTTRARCGDGSGSRPRSTS